VKARPADPITAAFEERAVRREGDRELPLGPKARRTREAILAAAADQFVAHGYLHTSIAAVAEAADVSLGTVYQYFRDRSDLVAALVQRGVVEMLRQDTTWRASEGRDGLDRVLGNFVRSYTTYASMAGVWEEVSHVDGDLAQLRRQLGRIFTSSVERELRRGAEAGVVRDDVDPAIAARALTAMVDRYCYVTYVFDPPRPLPSADESVATLASLWSAAVGLC
jgi:AcrR family transcriptional regulator